MLGHRCKNKEAKKLPTSDEEHIYSADTCGVAHDVRLTLMQRFFKDVGISQRILLDLHHREKWLKVLKALLEILICGSEMTVSAVLITGSPFGL